MAVGEKHVGLAVWSSHLMPELYLLGSGACIVLVFFRSEGGHGREEGDQRGASFSIHKNFPP